MEPRGDAASKFECLVRSFGIVDIPGELFVRACNPRLTWTPAGELVEKTPKEGGVPKWLTDLYAANKKAFELQDASQTSARLVKQDCTGLPGVGHHDSLGHDQGNSASNDCTVAQERIAVVLHALPSLNAEIGGEEAMSLFMDLLTTSVLPFLSSLTEIDIKTWLLPQDLDQRVPFLYSLFECMYHICHFLSFDCPDFPASFLTLVLDLASIDTPANCVSFCGGIVEILHFAIFGDLNESKLQLMQSIDEKSNATLGAFLSMFFKEVMPARHSKLKEDPGLVYLPWKPLNMAKSSTMEYLAAIGLGKYSNLAAIGTPLDTAVDATTTTGFLLSRHGKYEEAVKVLEEAIPVVAKQYGIASRQYGISVAELANCLNILRQEARAERWARAVVDTRNARSHQGQQIWTNLQFCLIDSLIGRAKYLEAAPFLEGIINDPTATETHRMMGVLRLAKTRRRLCESPSKAFEPGSPLKIGAELLKPISGTLQEYFVEEVACSLSNLSQEDVESSTGPTDLIQLVNDTLHRSVTEGPSPAFGWYRNRQEELLRHVDERAESNSKGKQSGSRQQNAQTGWNPGDETTDNFDPMSQAPSPPDFHQDDIRFPLRIHRDISEKEGPWSRKTIISFDSRGIHSYASLLILKQIMAYIEEIELNHPEGSVAKSDAYPWMDTKKYYVRYSHGSPRSSFLPCHYFDYVAGTSTGGLISILVGRLRLTVDEALESFAEFHASSVPITKYQASEAQAVVQSIIAGDFRTHDESASTEAVNSTKLEPFKYEKDRTRTMTFNLRERGNKGHREAGVFILRSYARPNRYPFFHLPISDIALWEAAYVAITSSKHFRDIEICGTVFRDEEDIACNLSLYTLIEFHLLHEMPPALYISIGTEPQTNRDESVGELFGLFLSPDIDFKELNSWTKICDAFKVKPRCRFEMQNLLDTIPFDEWQPKQPGDDPLRKIRNATDIYLAQDFVKEQIKSVAEVAVWVRRARARTERWETFALDVVYFCPLCLDDNRHSERKSLRNHFLKRCPKFKRPGKQPESFEGAIESLLDAGRVYL